MMSQSPGSLDGNDDGAVPEGSKSEAFTGE